MTYTVTQDHETARLESLAAEAEAETRAIRARMAYEWPRRLPDCRPTFEDMAAWCGWERETEE